MIHTNYNCVFEHYYQRFPYENLLHIQEYSNEKDNLLTIKHLEEMSVSVDTISEGDTD